MVCRLSTAVNVLEQWHIIAVFSALWAVSISPLTRYSPFVLDVSAKVIAKYRS